MFRKFISYYRPHRRLLSFVLTMVVMFSLIELSLPVFSRIILNQYIPQKDLQGVLVMAGIMSVFLVLYGLLQYLVGYYGHMLGISMENEMRIRAFEKLQVLPFDYYDTHKTGVIMARLTSDLHEVAELAHHGIEELLSMTTILVLGYLYLVRLNFWVTTGLFVVFLAFFAVLVFSRRQLIVAFRRLRREHASLNSHLEGSISGIRLTRAFANESFEIERFTDDNELYIDAYREAYRALGASNALNNVFIQFMNISVLVCGAFLVLWGRFSIGDLLVYFLYFGMLTGPVKRLMSMLETFQQGWAGFERFQKLLDEPVTITDAEDAIELGHVSGTIVFDNVSFRYGQEKNRILDRFSLTIPAGKMVALVGPSGVGKTTVAQIIPRFYEINGGSVTIDNRDIRQVKLRDLRAHIGYVQQDVTIFWGSVRDNIAYGKPGATDAQIISAAKRSGIHDFIMSLPQGYETMVGERGVMLSGGQKQRISIARIFLKDPEILILDEATSALDNLTEAYIQSSLEALTKGRTVLVVAHRLSTVRHADEIIVMGKEGIVQRGTHESLIEVPGHYRNLYEAGKDNRFDDGAQQ